MCKFIWKPSHSIAWDGTQLLFSTLTMNPAFSKSSLTWALATIACCSPLTLTIPSSRYTIAFRLALALP